MARGNLPREVESGDAFSHFNFRRNEQISVVETAGENIIWRYYAPALIVFALGHDSSQ